MEKFRGIQSKTSDVRWQLRFFFGILAVVTAANAVMLHLLSIPILPLFYLVAAVVYLVFSRVIDLRNFVFGYVCSFLMVAAQCIPFVYVLGDDCGIQLYLFSLIVPSNYIRLTHHSSRFKRRVYIFLSCTYLVLYLLFDEVLDHLMTPLDYLDNFGPRSEAMFTALNVVSSLVLLLVINYLFAKYLQTAVQRNEDLQRDFLTGLKNRHGMEPVLQAAYQQWRDNGQVFTICLGDVDLFKQINDQYGHEAGDEVLIRLGQLFRTHIPTGAVVCRWGGEEFLFLCPWTQQQTYTHIDRLRQDIAGERFVYGGGKLAVTMTFGLAAIQPGQGMDELIRLADQRLYDGKLHGRNRTVSGGEEAGG